MAFTEGFCQKLQTTLNRTAGQNAPSLKRDRVGYLEALLSDANTAGIEKIPVPTNGKKRMVQIDYIQRGTTATIGAGTEIDGCENDVEPAPFEQIIDVNEKVESQGLGFNENEMRKLCEGDDVYISNVLMSQRSHSRRSGSRMRGSTHRTVPSSSWRRSPTPASA